MPYTLALTLVKNYTDWQGWTRRCERSLVRHGLRADGAWIAMRHDGPATYYDLITPPPREDSVLVEAWGVPKQLPECVSVTDAGAGLAWLTPKPRHRWCDSSRDADYEIEVEYGHQRTGFYKARFYLKKL